MIIDVRADEKNLPASFYGEPDAVKKKQKNQKKNIVFLVFQRFHLRVGFSYPFLFLPLPKN